MKNIRNALYILFLLPFGAAFLSGCAEKEELNLADHPETRFGIKITDIKEPSPVLTLKATYNAQGMLVLDGEPSHDYLIRLSAPSPQDMTLRLEPIHVNIPPEKVVIGETEYVLPAGFVDIPVSVVFTDEDFSFAAPDKDAKTYEIGVRIAHLSGWNTVGEGVEAKIVIEKEAYSANISLANTEGRTVNFSRPYWNGEILETTPMSYDFKVYLDKPASADVTVTFSMTGLAQAFAGDWNVTPSSVVIPAGSLVSETVTWTLSDDFLLTTDQPENHTLTLNAAFESTDRYVSLAGEGDSQITFEVAKVFDALEVLSPNTVPGGWAELSTSGWSISGVSSASRLFDGNTGTGSTNYVSFTGTTGATVDVNMQSVRTISGFTVRATSSTYNVTIVEMLVSDDGVNYTSVGLKSGLTRPTTYYTFGLKTPVQTHYVRFVLKDTTGTKRLNEIDIFGT